MLFRWQQSGSLIEPSDEPWNNAELGDVRNESAGTRRLNEVDADKTVGGERSFSGLIVSLFMPDQGADCSYC